MLSYTTNYLATVPEITVYINCDTRLAINLSVFDLHEDDEFIFVIKNYDYIESPAEFVFRARKEDIDSKGEVIFKISPTDSRKLKPGAFYNLALLINAFSETEPVEYKKLTENGTIRLEYGAHDLDLGDVDSDAETSDNLQVAGIRLERVD